MYHLALNIDDTWPFSPGEQILFGTKAQTECWPPRVEG